mgnify:FL=1
MNLLVGLFLVLINSFNSATAKIPTTEGINALVAYLFTCIFFVFCAMLGYAGKSHLYLLVIYDIDLNALARYSVHPKPASAARG